MSFLAVPHWLNLSFGTYKNIFGWKIFLRYRSNFCSAVILFGAKDGSVLKFTISFVEGRYRVTDAILYGIGFCLHADMGFNSKLVYFITFHKELGTFRIWCYFLCLKPGVSHQWCDLFHRLLHSYTRHTERGSRRERDIIPSTQDFRPRICSLRQTRVSG